MKRIIIALAAAAALLTSCEEFQPVFTGKYDNPEAYAPFDPEESVTGTVLTIKELSQRFIAEAAKKDPKTDEPNSDNLRTWCWEVSEDLWIKGRITTSDRSGNFYKSFYIQDDANGPGIEIKVGRTSLHNDYKVGQMVYISLDGLSVGEYGFKSGSYGGQGTIQIGLKDPQQIKYSTSYIEDQYIIDRHVFRCDVKDLQPIAPRKISALPGKTECQATSDAVGALVTISGLKYAEEAFTLVYLNGNEANDRSENRIFLTKDNADKAKAPGNWGVTTWAMSKSKFLEYLNSGIWDKAHVGGGADNYGELSKPEIKSQLQNNANAYSVSQYFKVPDSILPSGLSDKEKKEFSVQIRTSGYSKFADLQIAPEVLKGSKTITVTGILTMYQGGVQLILRDQDDVVIE